MNEPSGGTNDTVPGDLAHLERRTEGWKEGLSITPDGESANVTSGVRDNRDVQSIIPEIVAYKCFPLLEVRVYNKREIRGLSDIQIFCDIDKEFLCVVSDTCSTPRNRGQ